MSDNFCRYHLMLICMNVASERQKTNRKESPYPLSPFPTHSHSEIANLM